jgi:hypothetical protein
MNGIHDMGGMHGMGPIQIEKNEPVFHADWEGRIYAITRALRNARISIDLGRHESELIPPADYLRMSYYERWLTREVELLVRLGIVTREEIESSHAAPDSKKGDSGSECRPRSGNRPDPGRLFTTRVEGRSSF